MAVSGFSALVLLCLVGIVLSVRLPGPCPFIETMPDFEITKFFGEWFEEKRYFEPSETNATCVSAKYSLRDDGSIRFVHTKINNSTGKRVSLEGTLLQLDPKEPGKLTITFPNLPVHGNFWILGIKYRFYVVIYSCRNIGSEHIEYAWILTRAQHPPDYLIKRALAVASSHKVDTRRFINSNQTHCTQHDRNYWGSKTVTKLPGFPDKPLTLNFQVQLKIGDEDMLEND